MMRQKSAHSVGFTTQTGELYSNSHFGYVAERLSRALAKLPWSCLEAA